MKLKFPRSAAAKCRNHRTRAANRPLVGARDASTKHRSRSTRRDGAAKRGLAKVVVNKER